MNNYPYKHVSLNNTAITVLNYMTKKDIKIMLRSFKRYYPDIRTLIVDNGSPSQVIEMLRHIAKQYHNTTILSLPTNVGFAQGHNMGIRLLRDEGYKYICCSNSDIIFSEHLVLEKLKQALINAQASVAGPKIQRGLRGGYHTPLDCPPRQSEVRNMYLKHKHPLLHKINSKINKFKIQTEPNFKELRDHQHRLYYGENKKVYQLQGSFIMFGPRFFSHYNGFDPNTFLYYEEAILAEMLAEKNMLAVFVPDANIDHSENKTTRLIWGTSNKKIKRKYMLKSFLYWYNNYYIKHKR